MATRQVRSWRKRTAPIENFLREAGVPRDPFIMLHQTLGNEFDAQLVVVAAAVDNRTALVSLTPANLRAYASRRSRTRAARSRWADYGRLQRPILHRSVLYDGLQVNAYSLHHPDLPGGGWINFEVGRLSSAARTSLAQAFRDYADVPSPAPADV